jgi:hypothetical protein
MIFSEEKVQEILKMLENGITQKDASVLAGIAETTWHKWKRENSSICSRVEASILKYKYSLVQIVNVGCLKDPKLALEILARKYPNEYGTKQQVELVDPEAQIQRMMNIITGKEPIPPEYVSQETN